MGWLVVAVIAGAGTTERDGTGKEVGREAGRLTTEPLIDPDPELFSGCQPFFARSFQSGAIFAADGWVGGTVVSNCLCLRSASFEVLENKSRLIDDRWRVYLSSQCQYGEGLASISVG